MPYAGTAAITELWAKSVLAFGRSLGVSAASTTVDVQLKNNAGTVLSTGVVPAATQSSAGLMTAADKATLDNLVVSGGEPNQNAWSNFVFGGTTVSANAKTDTFTFTAGAGVTFSVNAANKAVEVSAAGTTYSDFTGATSGAAGSHGLVPAPPSGGHDDVLFGDAEWSGLALGFKRPTRLLGVYRDDASDEANLLHSVELPLAEASSASLNTAGLMSGPDKYKLDNVVAPKASPTFTGTPKAPTAAAGTNTTQIATTAFVQSAISAASVGAASFQGTLSQQSTLESSAYKSGWYWVVGTAGTYAGEACEPGDMVFAVADKGGSYSASDFSVVQNNLIEMTAAEVDAICTL